MGWNGQFQDLKISLDFSKAVKTLRKKPDNIEEALKRLRGGMVS
ncbi:MAG: hypothetical protein QXH10_09480 [Ignisphaera sp.]